MCMYRFRLTFFVWLRCNRNRNRPVNSQTVETVDPVLQTYNGCRQTVHQKQNASDSGFDRSSIRFSDSDSDSDSDPDSKSNLFYKMQQILQVVIIYFKIFQKKLL